MRIKIWMIAAVAFLSATGAQAQVKTLTSGTAKGDIIVDVVSYGTIFETRPFGNGFYRPIAPIGGGETISFSTLYYRISGNDELLRFTSEPADFFELGSPFNDARSGLSEGPLDLLLEQRVSRLFDGGVQTGSLMTQSYTLHNSSANAITLELTRYANVKLIWPDGNDADDGGGMLMGPDGQPWLMVTDLATGPAVATNFVGIYNVGGTFNGYEIGKASDVIAHILANTPLNNSVAGDGADADLFVDPGYGGDLAMALGALLHIEAGSTATFVTHTFFRTGLPTDINGVSSGVPEPANWAMMILGFCAMGGTLRHRARLGRCLSA